ncbi:hypothetical protein D0T84_09160 [Dysgonomonas sp. 521]|uniref:hypothetical protein n=1 Tax=Dysgonomonas sp. 521 TaxID=2302932 RepID=UPI0013CF67D0|nr:hypothetical protein [Dysgonomonas sp. 521]NDV95086.1 hypothetical protein [Dysgonomonas sp. 521]
MKQLALIFILFLFFACSSLDNDAKKAAELNKQSIEYAKDADLQKAEELYKESQEIVNSYIGTDEYEEFRKLYHQYMEEAEK